MVDISVTGHNQITLMEVSGRIDSFNANELGDALTGEIDGGNIQIVLDLGNVEFMSSAGLRELVNSLKRTKRAGGDLRLAQPSDRVREVLEMSGLDTVLRIYASHTDAINSY